MTALYPYIYRLLATAWVGCLWAAGFLVAPLLFSTLPRTQAGEVAAQMFGLVGSIGLVAGAAMLALLLWRRRSTHMAMAKIACVAIMLSCTLGLEQLVTPRIQQAKAQLRSAPQNIPAHERFARWHKVSSTVYIFNCILGVVLVAAGVGPQRIAGSLPRR